MTMTNGQASVKSVAEVRDALEELNETAGEVGVWVRTQANSPAQRPWFTDHEGKGAIADGRVAVGQLKTLPYHWRWKDFSPFLSKLSAIAAASVESPIALIDRQSILLVNPGMQGRLQVSSAIRCAISVYNPGDIAPTHVHSPNASRTILSPRGGYTTIEGEICAVERGDVIITPNGTWHDHGNDNQEPVIWADVLDWPLLEYLDCAWVDQDYKGGYLRGGVRIQQVTHEDGYSNRLYGNGGVVPALPHKRGFGIDPSPLFHYKGTVITEVLRGIRDHEGDPFEAIKVNLVNPVTGRPVNRTLNYSAQLIRPGETTQFKRETCSTLFTVIEGTGVTEVGDQAFEWEPNDLFVVPNFLWRRHVNTSKGDAILYAISDESLMRNIGQYRAQGKAGGGVTDLTE
jgi:gentisate 1,2-dioxygenase